MVKIVDFLNLKMWLSLPSVTEAPAPAAPVKIVREDNKDCQLPLYPKSDESIDETGLRLGECITYRTTDESIRTSCSFVLLPFTKKNLHAKVVTY